MKNSNKFSIGLQIIVLIAVAALAHQVHDLQRINASMKKATANMAIELKAFLAPPPPPESIATGIEAPDFSLKDENDQSMSLATLQKNKKKILVFSSTTCPYCQEYYPELDKFAKENEHIEVVLIQAGSKPDENKKFLVDNKYDFTVLVAEQQVFQDYKISGTPTTVILDENNKVSSTTMASTYDDLNRVMNGSDI